MGQKELDGFFAQFMTKAPLFLNKKVLQANYTPDSIMHRDDQIKQIAQVLSPCLRNEKPSNLFIYGKTGTGKTVSIKYTTSQIHELTQKNNIPLSVLYLNCKLKKVADTEYRVIAQLARELHKEVPTTGLPTDEVYNIFYKTINETGGVFLIILDEIDQLVKKVGDEILYNLTRINSELDHAQVSLVGISNDLMFADNLDPRVKSSLSEEYIVFPPYNALQIQDILKERAAKAFKPHIIQTGVIEKCAALSAREHGDVRRALELLRVAGEISERRGATTVIIAHLDEAEEKIEKDRVMELVSTQPKQFQAVLYSILHLSTSQKDNQLITGDVYEIYKHVCKQTGLIPLTQRRISDIIAELDMLGIICSRVISKGRYGRTREISVAVPENTIPKIYSVLLESLDLKE